MAFDNALGAIAEDNDETRWAFGTGFHDPLAGIDTSVPDGIDQHALASYCLMLGDDALIMSHRLQEWCTHAPELEEEVALANIALDLLGQARLLLSRAGAAENEGRDEDALAYFRDAPQFRNVGLAEAENGDFAHSTVRLLLFATWRLALLDRLTASRDPVLAAIAAKSVKEVAYHRDYAALWTIRLGDGTDLSHARTQQALDALWPHTGELFTAHNIERALATAGVAVDPSDVREEFDTVLDEVLAKATLQRPDPVQPYRAGRDGEHSAPLSDLLTELQSVARAHPGATW
ncbi:phenylacetate-CoA oxygenase subunit PaaI [Actinomadura sp. KC06]|uniref:1,2-phenylacetyl-CoA epoxidase subunit PaaC n=1 Tax=Actinomadura sp. KC06 TaxID=2530369 RepID=UPI0010431596|nr:1,2-phenylacetyl-CoA epoxidase subunit PaaC [Actinomadura sp. KC06]TDD35939.1 phenylacetate-CoA oxygenase subunit PaaI [Actinomadura sp. KC06]